ncbi:MAG: tetraacyldisaccharide 4'-kinase [Mariprofundales bacterium]|nr:tetraacyldisaccharide 4'-kinase [Mariprofundales bacterium]
MHAIAQRVERFWWRNGAPPLWLQPLALIYRWANSINLQRRHRHAEAPPLPAIFIGNITVGGSGKTPFVIRLADELRQRGAAPVIVCRGDGGSLQQPQLVTAADDPATVGDEACMMAQMVDTPVVAGHDRVAGARLAATLGDIMLLDDALQYRQLARVTGSSCEVVLLPAAGVGNGALLPIGPLREPLSALQRADIIVISGEESLASLLLPTGTPCFHWSNPVVDIVDVMATGCGEPPDRVHLVTAIARPQRVVDSLLRLGIEVVGQTQFADHYPYRQQDIDHLAREEYAVVTTMKDAVKIRRLWPVDRALWVCQHQGDMESSLVERIGRAIGYEFV